MNEDEKEEILLRLDERTKRVDENIERLDTRVSEIEEITARHDDRISDNEDAIETYQKATKGLGSAILAVITGLVAKLAGFVRI